MRKALSLSLLFCPLLCFAVSSQKFFETQRLQRLIEMSTIKSAVTQFDGNKPLPKQLINGDEERYSDLRGSFGKALRHQGTGYINQEAFRTLLLALYSHKPTDFDAITLGTGLRKLVNPQGSLAYSLSACDSWLNALPPAPAFASNESGAEMVELYWTVLVRDIPFSDYSGNATVAQACTELATFKEFTGPTTPANFLRGETPGDLLGPYISQFLYLDVPYGPQPFEQKQPTSETTNNFMTDFNSWFQVVNGGPPAGTYLKTATPVYLNTARDLANFVHDDIPGQIFINALCILMSYGPDALDPNNPYKINLTQEGFVSYGFAQALALISEAIEEGLKAAWFHKWQVNRRLRPEEYGFYVNEQANGKQLGIPQKLMDSAGLAGNTTNFLTQVYPEGSPAHPSYPAGHATISGACATILKAFFNENYIFDDPQVVNPGDTTSLMSYVGDKLTVGNELNKLAANISLGRDHAGVHYRSDGIQGILLGEKVAIDILNNASFLQNENFDGFTLTKFNGEKITVGKKRKP